MRRKEHTIVSPSGFTSRYTDSETLDIFLQSYCGLVNKRLVESLQKHGINAVGLSGIDGRLWEATRKKKIIGRLESEKTNKFHVISDSITGSVDNVNTSLIELLLTNGYMPVLSAPAISFEHEIINVDNDRAIALMVGPLHITEVVSLFAAPGLLRDVNDSDSLVRNINITNSSKAMHYAKGRMKKKILGARESFKQGLKTMYFGDGRIINPVSSALKGNGTTVQK